MNKIKTWLKKIGCEGTLTPITSDASLRKYYRLTGALHSGVVMDTSAQKESLSPFIQIDHHLYEAGVRTVKINAFDLEQGFAFLEDLGDRHLAYVARDDFDYYYTKAIDTIVKMQHTSTEGLPLYDETFLRFEMDLMQEWYLQKYLGITLTEQQQTTLNESLSFITAEVLAQPNGLFVHRDYHSRNLMIGCSDEIVVIDFQDARVGAVTYDLVSLLRDVYVELDPADVTRLALHFRDIKGLNVDDETFMRWFDFMGLQRHIKILGIFARLSLRDGKDGYLKDIPLTLKYILKTAQKYPETQPLGRLLGAVA
jgi:aminoglycoside/choline kinase family phosphotransferase